MKDPCLHCVNRREPGGGVTSYYICLLNGHCEFLEKWREAKRLEEFMKQQLPELAEELDEAFSHDQ